MLSKCRPIARGEPTVIKKEITGVELGGCRC